MTRQHLLISTVALAAAIGAPAVVSLTASDPGSPRQTIETFLHAAASGNAATACAQLSAQAERDVVQGASCETGIRNGASVYGSIIGQLRIADLKITGNTATASSTLSGHPTATFQLKKSGDKWLIVAEQRVQAATSAGADSGGPTQARVESVAGCLDRTFGAVENAGVDGTGGVPHVVLSVDIAGYSAAEVDVFSSALAAVSGYRGIKAYESSLTTKLTGGSVIVYLMQVTAKKRSTIEACG